MPPMPPDRSGHRRSNVAKRLSAMLSEIESDGRARATSDTSKADRDDSRARSAGAALFDQDTARTIGSSAEGPADPLPAGPGHSGAGVDGGGPKGRPHRRNRRHMIALGVFATFLIVSIPALGYTGFQRLLRSRGGSVAHQSSDSSQPGFEAVVEPTPTALVIQTDGDGIPQSLTVLALGVGDGGGTVLFVPIDTMLERPLFLLNRIRLAGASGNLELVAHATASLLRIGFTETIIVDDSKWAELVEPVAPIPLENPDRVETDNAVYPVGPIELPPAEVGPYLLARTGGQESDLNRINRQELFWRAWIDAVSGSPRKDPVPGETDTGIGRFIRTMARGAVDFETLPVIPVDGTAADGHQMFFPDLAAIRELITQAVPFPIAAFPDDRFLARLLNGVRGELLPTTVTDPIVAAGAQITTIGNAARFGQETTTIEYHDEADKKWATAVRDALGAGEVVLDAGSDDTVALTITIGRDVLGESGEGPTTTTDPSTPDGTSSTETSVDNGDGTGGTGD